MHLGQVIQAVLLLTSSFNTCGTDIVATTHLRLPLSVGSDCFVHVVTGNMNNKLLTFEANSSVYSNKTITYTYHAVGNLTYQIDEDAIMSFANVTLSLTTGYFSYLGSIRQATA